MSDPTLTTYQRLAARFDTHKTRNQGGMDVIYLTGEQVISRLNDVLGVAGWSFSVVREGSTEVEAWVLGELTATIDGQIVARQQYGNQELMRGQRATADLFKSAATDAAKKCATMIGIGLYLYDADERREVQAEMRGQPAGNARPVAGSGPRSMPSSGAGGSSTAAGSNDTDILYCEECNEPLTETQFKDGTNWPPTQLAVFGRRKHSRILCMTHYREANQAKRRAEEALQQVPF